MTEIIDPVDYIALHQNEDAFDFPMAYCWRAYYRETVYGEYLPLLEPPNEPRPIVNQQVIEHRVIKTHDRELTRKVLDHEGSIKYLLEKQKEREDRQKGSPKHKYA